MHIYSLYGNVIYLLHKVGNMETDNVGSAAENVNHIALRDLSNTNNAKFLKMQPIFNLPVSKAIWENLKNGLVYIC